MKYINSLFASLSGMVVRHGRIARIAVFLSVAIPVFTHAQSASEKAVAIFCNIAGFLQSIALVIGIIYVVIASFKYITAQGDASKISDAHRTILYGAIGIFVALIAEGVPDIVASIVGGDVPGGC